MKKIINIEGRDIAFASNGATLLLYKRKFGKDFLNEIIKIMKVQNKDGTMDVENMDMSALDRMNEFAYICYETANKGSGLMGYDEWLSSFDDPLELTMHFEEIMELIGKSFNTNVKPKNKKKSK